MKRPSRSIRSVVLCVTLATLPACSIATTRFELVGIPCETIEVVRPLSTVTATACRKGNDVLVPAVTRGTSPVDAVLGAMDAGATFGAGLLIKQGVGKIRVESPEIRLPAVPVVP